ncbi:MAG: YeeE/YedE family protein [Pseudobdellovibrionaceae bacterium]|nr:YeeE/YedE family protein [Bdellovibrionales bacterium]USN47693.1 MAG: YeeE/YedE family protein [Pseudobdellovibrionaceae bacterium]
MRVLITSFTVGLLFALGLGIAGMTRPDKIQSFLDLAGDWDPSLIFVMVGAVGVHFFVYRLARKKSSPLFATSFNIPSRRDITWRLVIGAAIFGVGWGLGGFCPGPGLVSVPTGAASTLTFIVAMVGGFLTFRLADQTLLKK